MRARLILIASLYWLASLSAHGQSDSKRPVQLKDQTASICLNPQSTSQLLKCAESFGKVSSYTVTTGAVANAAPNKFSFERSWVSTANVLVITYSTPVELWRVASSLCQLETGSWLMQANPRERGLTKQQIVELYALPNCVSTPQCLQQTNPPPTCPEICQKQTADEVIRYVAQVTIQPGTPMAFGVAGPNIWGKGGGLQWQVLNDFPIKDGINAVTVWR